MTMNSSVVAAGDQALAAQYNNLRLDVLDRAGDVATTAGTANVRTLTLDTSVIAYTTGMVINFKSNINNTASVTINVNSMGAKTIKKTKAGGLNNLETLDLASGLYYKAIYDGTYFQLLSPAYEMPSSAKVALSTLQNADTLHTHTALTFQAKTGTFTRATATGSGDEVVTGIGFTPKLIMVTYAYETSGSAYHVTGSGTADGVTSERCTGLSVSNSGVSSGTSTTNIIAGSSSGTGFWVGDLSAIGADGFTITFTMTATPGSAISVNYTCFGQEA